MSLTRIVLAAAVAAAALFIHPQPVRAAPGVPGSPDFGYAARLELDGLYFQDALDLADDLSLDWLAVTVSWSDIVSRPDGPHAARLNQAMQSAAQNGIPVLVSITRPPAAALSASGPNASQAAAFALSLVRRYPAVLQAIELFPAANTASGWGAAPDPVAYAALYRAVRAALDQAGYPILLVAGGLKPLQSSRLSSDMDDLAFLQSLYQTGLTPPVISLALDESAADPLTAPNGSDRRILRHYEEVRRVMLQNQHNNGLVWITSFSAPSGTISRSDLSKLELNTQVSWLQQAFVQLRSQLYVGLAVYNSLNPPAGTSPSRALIVTEQEYHPFIKVFRDLVSQNSTGQVEPQNGRPKDKALEKRPT